MTVETNDPSEGASGSVKENSWPAANWHGMAAIECVSERFEVGNLGARRQRSVDP